MKNYYSKFDEIVDWVKAFAHSIDCEWSFTNAVTNSLDENNILGMFNEWNAADTNKPFIIYFYNFGTFTNYNNLGRAITKLVAEHRTAMRFKMIINKDKEKGYVEETSSYNNGTNVYD